MKLFVRSRSVMCACTRIFSNRFGSTGQGVLLAVDFSSRCSKHPTPSHGVIAKTLRCESHLYESVLPRAGKNSYLYAAEEQGRLQNPRVFSLICWGFA